MNKHISHRRWNDHVFEITCKKPSDDKHIYKITDVVKRNEYTYEEARNALC